jgi:Lrp/AsnC family transcriptional regulator, leucine-responsive regulatory protein
VYFAVSDAIDHEILSLLSENSRRSFTELGQRVALSPNAVAERVRRLHESGVLKRFSITVDQRALGRGLEAIVDARLLMSTDPDHFERVVGELASVRELIFLTGSFDYQVRLACCDADDLDHTVRAIRQRAGAAATETRIVMRTRTFSPSFPSPSAADR